MNNFKAWERDQAEIARIKDQIKELHQPDTIDLSMVNDLYMAKRALHLTEKGLTPKYLELALRMERNNITKGMDIFGRLKFMEGFLNTAPRYFFRAGADR